MGLMLGLLVGCGFFIFKLDDYFRELDFYKHLSQRQEPVQEEKVNEKLNGKNKVTTPYQPVAKLKITEVNVDSVRNATEPVSRTSDSIPERDTLTIPALAGGIPDRDNSIVVRKDELLETRQVELLNMTMLASTSKDSLLQKVSGIRDDGNSGKQAITVEFWHSPINYKGYKMAKNKVVLFGMDRPEEISLYKLDEGIYIKLQKGVYKLDYTNVFRQLERINDEALLARLK